MSSPWWYRNRALVMGAIYLAGFSAFGAGAGTPAAVALGERFGAHGTAAVLGAALLLVACCVLLRAWGASYLRASTVWSADSRADALVTGGPFGYTRNPLYLGNVLMALGIGSFAPPLGWLFINIADMAFVVALIHWEERGLRERFGARFDAYAARVPQLFPRLRPAPADGAVRASFRDGLRSEIFTCAIFAGAVAVVFSPAQIGWPIFGMLYLLGISLQTAFARADAAVQAAAGDSSK